MDKVIEKAKIIVPKKRYTRYKKIFKNKGLPKKAVIKY